VQVRTSEIVFGKLALSEDPKFRVIYGILGNEGLMEKFFAK